eukprot:3344119-Karenia_brevis.AAC.1
MDIQWHGIDEANLLLWNTMQHKPSRVFTLVNHVHDNANDVIICEVAAPFKDAFAAHVRVELEK